mgnify:FL=1
MKLINDFMGLFRSPSDGSEAPLREAAGDLEGFRRLSDNSTRDIAPMGMERMWRTVEFLYRANPLGHFLIEISNAFLFAEGCTLKVSDPECQEILDGFWNDPINKLDENLPRLWRENKIMGNLLLVAFVNEMNGHVRLGYLDPRRVAHVVYDPDNAMQPIGVITKKDKKGNFKRYRVIVVGPESVFAPTARRIREEDFTDGDIFFFARNMLMGDEMGKSDLLPVMDGVDAYDQAVFGELERWTHLRSFIWDVELKGATQDQVNERAKDFVSPETASVRIHNDSEKWDTVSPDLNSDDSDVLARLIRNHVLGSKAIPEHWFGGGGDVNRATAQEMGEPTLKMLSMEQRAVKHMLETIAIFVVLRGIQPKGELPMPHDVPAEFRPQAVFAELTSKDTSKYATAMTQVASACSMAIDRGLLTEETAVALLAVIAGQLGYEFDPAEELKKAREQAKARRATDLLPSDFDDDLPEEPDPMDPDAADAA